VNQNVDIGLSRMNSLLHTVGAIAVVPYVALAAFFLFLGEAARAKGLFGLLAFAWNNLDWFLGWGIYTAPALWLCLVATGFVPSLQRAGSLCLGLLAVACFLVVVLLTSDRGGMGGFIFLLPCAAVAATSAWVFVRMGRAPSPIHPAQQITDRNLPTSCK
jgi:hypothetical protein